jgi:hypothetical protein
MAHGALGRVPEPLWSALSPKRHKHDYASTTSISRRSATSILMGFLAAHQPARDIFGCFRAWPKNLGDFACSAACLAAISECRFCTAEAYPFRPDGIHHNSKLDRDDSQSVPESRDSSTASIPRGRRPVPGRGAATRPGSRRSWLRTTGRCGSGS